MTDSRPNFQGSGSGGGADAQPVKATKRTEGKGNASLEYRPWKIRLGAVLAFLVGIYFAYDAVTK
jgi:hypothetical protein